MSEDLACDCGQYECEMNQIIYCAEGTEMHTPRLCRRESEHERTIGELRKALKRAEEQNAELTSRLAAFGTPAWRAEIDKHHASMVQWEVEDMGTTGSILHHLSLASILLLKGQEDPAVIRLGLAAAHCEAAVRAGGETVSTSPMKVILREGGDWILSAFEYAWGAPVFRPENFARLADALASIIDRLLESAEHGTA